MNQPLLKTLAFRIAMIAGFLAGIIVLISTYSLPISFCLSASGISILIVAISIYFIFLSYVRKYVTLPIRSLYKAIYNVKVEDGEKLDIALGEEPMNQIQLEVSDWMKNRANEIEDLKKLED